MTGPRPSPPPAGLCERCRHARLVRTPRSAFWLCGRSAMEPGYARYPRLPVLACPGHEPGEPARGAAPAETPGGGTG